MGIAPLRGPRPPDGIWDITLRELESRLADGAHLGSGGHLTAEVFLVYNAVNRGMH